MIETPAPGIYPGTPFAVYAAWSAVNHGLLHLFTKSPAHARYAMTHGGLEPTPALDFGAAFHAAVLEPERFAEDYIVVPPDMERRSRIGKLRWAQFERAAGTRIRLDHDEHEQIKGMAAAVRALPTAAALLLGRGLNETSALWLDSETGELCKGRQDRVTTFAGWTWIVDLKTTFDASPRAFARDVFRYGYHEQAAMYLDGLAVLHPPESPRRFAWVVVEKDPPFCVAAYEPTARAIAAGRRAYRAHLDTFRRCRESGEWPGYADGISPIELPGWIPAPPEEEAA